jgi:hypothetical protein
MNPSERRRKKKKKHPNKKPERPLLEKCPSTRALQSSHFLLGKINTILNLLFDLLLG